MARYAIRRTKIVCTIGADYGSAGLIERLMRAGMNVARLNLSHSSLEAHARCVRVIRRLAERLSLPVAILLDLPGPKYRTGRLRGDSVRLKKGSQITLTTREISGTEAEVSVNLPTFPQDVRVGDTVLLDDGAMELRVVSIQGSEVVARVVVGGTLLPNKGLVVPGRPISTPFISERLREYIRFALEQQPDYIALSFVSGAPDVEQARELLRQGGSDVPLIAKIERGDALKRFDEILRASDAIMVARGDLGVEIPLERVPLVQKDIIRKCNLAGKPVITATQMLESMINSPRPTRAEVTDVANAIFDGTDAVMLSAETSVGKYPVPSVRVMARIARAAESKLPYASMLKERGDWLGPQTDELISYNACLTAYRLKAACIVAFTQSGSTARRVSKYRPSMPILAITLYPRVCQRLALCWGVMACPTASSSSVEDLFATGARLAKESGLARSGDLIVITGGIPVGVAGKTNLLKVERVG